MKFGNVEVSQEETKKIISELLAPEAPTEEMLNILKEAVENKDFITKKNK